MVPRRCQTRHFFRVEEMQMSRCRFHCLTGQAVWYIQKFKMSRPLKIKCFSSVNECSAVACHQHYFIFFSSPSLCYQPAIEASGSSVLQVCHEWKNHWQYWRSCRLRLAPSHTETGNSLWMWILRDSGGDGGGLVEKPDEANNRAKGFLSYGETRGKHRLGERLHKERFSWKRVSSKRSRQRHGNSQKFQGRSFQGLWGKTSPIGRHWAKRGFVPRSQSWNLENKHPISPHDVFLVALQKLWSIRDTCETQEIMDNCFPKKLSTVIVRVGGQGENTTSVLSSNSSSTTKAVIEAKKKPKQNTNILCQSVKSA